MIQETNPGCATTKVRIYTDQKTGASRFTHLKPSPRSTSTPELVQSSQSFTPPVANDNVYNDSMQEYYVWLICRMDGSDGKQPVPALGGFISATGRTPVRKSTIDYFTPINQPITEYSTVQELLRQSEVATAEVAGGENGQQYVINTIDLGVCMKAIPLVWRFPDTYKKHIIIPDQFHTAMNYMGMITGHKCRGSGYSEILLEAQLVTSGCLKSVLSGKAYSGM